EGEIVGRTVEKILARDYPRDSFRLNVVADNCEDDTAGIARNAGATVLERRDPVNRGKGHALAYALETLKDEAGDAVLFLDADSSPERDYLRVLASYRARGDVMIQGCYDVTEPDRNWFTRLTATSFVLRNRYQFPACDAWGLTLPLRGSGMCFERALIYRLGWESHGLNEDMEMTLRLIRDGIPVTFAPQAVSRQFMPATHICREN
ncbi:MAG: glycosyltransferase family 2 protein, partial [Planctomycetaceae bacterium]|nr:glycosyltransferase family 2 protein [Planctomycetaceae bacterium]